MALVPANTTWAVHPKTKQRFVLPFGKSQFFVPEAAVVSFPKRSNRVADGHALGVALATKAPEKWLPYCDPDCLLQLKGVEGTSVYTTFETPGHYDEPMFLRHIGSAIAEKCFPQVDASIQKQIQENEGPHRADPSTYNERQAIRYSVLSWTKSIDCPSRAQLHPELNQWSAVSRDGSDQQHYKSCKIDPPSKARPKGPADKRAAGCGGKRKVGLEELPMLEDVTICEEGHPYRKWSLTVSFEDVDNPPVLTKRGNFWILDQYSCHLMSLTTRGAAAGAPAAAAAASGAAAGDDNCDDNDI